MTDDLRLLAVQAHPDDESRIIGGTLAKYASEGVRVVVWIATGARRARSLATLQPDSQRPALAPRPSFDSGARSEVYAVIGEGS